MTLTPDEVKRRRKKWMDGTGATPRRRCPTCGATFHTRVGLNEHVRLGCGNGAGSPVHVRHSQEAAHAARAAKLEAGRARTANDGVRRAQCDTCGLVSTLTGLVAHQRSTGHAGRGELVVENQQHEQPIP